MVPLYRLVADAGLLGSYTGIVIVYTGMQLPLTVFLYAGFLRAQPREYEEAALIDGAHAPADLRAHDLPAAAAGHRASCSCSTRSSSGTTS